MVPAYKDVNFIPEEVLESRRKETQKKVSNRTSVAVLIVSVAITLGLLGYNQYLVKQNASIKRQVLEEEAVIEGLKEFGKTGYNLGVRLEAIKGVLNTRYYYSKLVDELNRRAPDSVEIKEFNVSEAGSLALSGISHPNYTPIAEFQDRLLIDSREENALFSDVAISSATLDKDQGSINFGLQIMLNMEALNEYIE